MFSSFTSHPSCLVCLSLAFFLLLIVHLSSPTTAQRASEEWDYILIGLGTAGSALLNRLVTNNPTASILVLETGENLTNDPNVITAAGIPTVTSNARYTQAVPAQIDPVIQQSYPWNYGRMWGGSSAHNREVEVRGSPALFAQWAEVGGAQWEYDALLPIFRFIESFHPNDNTPLNRHERGTHGALHIRQSDNTTQRLTNLVATAIQHITAQPIIADYNAGINTGISTTTQYFQKDVAGTRSFGGDFLRGIVDDHGRGVDGKRVRVRSLATVIRVLFDTQRVRSTRRRGGGLRATGVEYLWNDATVVSTARRIILSAGVNSPLILERSGIGKATLLTQHNIPVLIDNPLVGEQLTTQIGPIMVMRTADPALITEVRAIPANANLAGLSLLPLGTTSTNAERKVQLNVAAANQLPPAVSAALGLDRINNTFSFFAWNLLPSSRGFSHITSAAVTHTPDVAFRFYSTPDDVANGIAIYRLMFRVFQTLQASSPHAGIELLYPPGDTFRSDAAIRQALLSVVSITDHFASTVRMDNDVRRGVVDGRLRVHGTMNVYVADCGVFPVITDANTAHGAYVVGVKLADMLEGDEAEAQVDEVEVAVVALATAGAAGAAGEVYECD